MREEWGLDGIICSDGGGLRLLVSDHQAFADLPAAAAACAKAGINQFLERYLEPLTQAVERGLLSEAELDRALRGVFRAMLRLGLLDPPAQVVHSHIGQDRELTPWSEESTRAFVRTVTQKSIVLLENRRGLLPLERSRLKSLAVLGPRCNEVWLDWYSGMPPYSIPPRDGIDWIIEHASALLHVTSFRSSLPTSTSSGSRVRCASPCSCATAGRARGLSARDARPGESRRVELPLRGSIRIHA